MELEEKYLIFFCLLLRFLAQFFLDLDEPFS